MMDYEDRLLAVKVKKKNTKKTVDNKDSEKNVFFFF